MTTNNSNNTDTTNNSNASSQPQLTNTNQSAEPLSELMKSTEKDALLNNIDESQKYFQSKFLMQPPVMRSAFSDRQAWLMAELSRLCYFPFEGGHQIDKFLDIAKTIVDNPALFNKLKLVADAVLCGHRIGEHVARNAFEKILVAHGFKLLATFNENETQAFLATRGLDAYLIYRGTESFGDVKADISARLIDVDLLGIKTQVHQGFWNQFMDVHPKVMQALEQVKNLKLHIGGHSLGGALAHIATRFYASDTGGSTYTFGAPAVGLPSFQDHIKTPIYRIVNARDPVPLLPNPAMVHALGFIWHYFSRLLGFIGTKRQKAVADLLRDMAKMDQIGYPSRIIYDSGQPKLRYSFSVYQRFMLWLDEPWFNFSLENRFISHHKISHYTKALRQWGEHRVTLK
ncbi:lipase family protein [Aliikangiella maris]|uniref:Lipase family protein n=2 Tax=Aliikangiella maris TaxID=3162458 RepID=A0ABV3MIW4_9GAMM